MVSEVKSDLYLTMSLAYVDQTTGRVAITQCGHPNPAILSPDGSVRFHGSGGLPIGLITDATYQTTYFNLAPGERLVLYSDGFTESRDASGAELEEEGFAALLTKNAQLRGQEFFEALTWDLDYFADGPDMPDDISSVVFDYLGNAPDR
jgi:sigma-B regulation protein RsbU (phosphoserine phosphatase)